MDVSIDREKKLTNGGRVTKEATIKTQQKVKESTIYNLNENLRLICSVFAVKKDGKVIKKYATVSLCFLYIL